MNCKQFQIGDTTGFICGTKPDHECDDNGVVMAILKSGNYIPLPSVDDESEVIGGCVSCSICGKPYTPPIF